MSGPKLRIVREVPVRRIDWTIFTPGCAPFDHPITCRCPIKDVRRG